MTTISASNFLYFRDNSGIEYSYDNVNWAPVLITDWPLTIANLNAPGLTYLEVLFVTDITLSLSTSQYFICGTPYIQFGSRTLQNNGTKPIITIQGLGAYPGLIQNGDLVSAGYSNISVCNLDIHADAVSGTTLAPSGGWIGQVYFCNGSIENHVVNCSSDGDITDFGGGIVGVGAAWNGGGLVVTLCSSSGSITTGGGGIVGRNAGENGGNVRCTGCFSSGTIGLQAGGIFGGNAGPSGGAVAEVCYSTGLIVGDAAGGIFGYSSGAGGEVAASGCYSEGDIIGNDAGGIYGDSCALGGGLAVADNCYSKGTINGSNGTGGIIGKLYGTITLTYCYTSGFNTSLITPLKGGIIGDDPTDPPSTYSESFNGNGGQWLTSSANGVLQNVPTTSYIGTTWAIGTPAIVNSPYELRKIGFSSYDLTNILVDYSMQTEFYTTITAGNSTIPSILPTGYDYSILDINSDFPSAYPTITINSVTGAISASLTTVPGNYVVTVRNHINPYFYSLVYLTVEEAAAQLGIPVPQSLPPCCDPNVCHKDPQSTNYDNTHQNDTRAGKIIDKNVSDFYLGVATGQRTAYSQPVFKSYYDYMRYLQGKHR